MRAMERSEEREESQDWELNIIRPEEEEARLARDNISLLLPRNPNIMLIVTIENLMRRVFGTSLSIILFLKMVRNANLKLSYGLLR